MENLRAWRGDPALKARFVYLLKCYSDDTHNYKRFWALSEFLHGIKAPPNDPRFFAGSFRFFEGFGIPESTTRLIQEIGDHLWVDEGMAFAVDACDAIAVNARLWGIEFQMKIWALCQSRPLAFPDGQIAIDLVINLNKRLLLGNSPTTEEWRLVDDAVFTASDTGRREAFKVQEAGGASSLIHLNAAKGHAVSSVAAYADSRNGKRASSAANAVRGAAEALRGARTCEWEGGEYAPNAQADSKEQEAQRLFYREAADLLINLLKAAPIAA